MPGPSRVIQSSFAGGMFRSVSPELIPANGVYDLQNGLLDEDGSVYGRGGTDYLGPGTSGAVHTLWRGTLRNGGKQTVWFSTSGYGTLAENGTVTQVDSYGLPRGFQPAVLDDVLYLPGGQKFDGSTHAAAPKVGFFYAAVANRLFVASGNRIDFSAIIAAEGAAPNFVDTTNFHLFPGGVTITGLYPLRDSLVVFTTGGAYVLGGLALNLTDENGNVQQRMDHYAPDLDLWQDSGIAAYAGGIVVPARDGVWLMQIGVTSEVPQPLGRISDSISELYRSYLDAGCKPGKAVTHRGHYFLPILTSVGSVVDMLVCRLDAVDAQGSPTYPWTRLRGQGAQMAALVDTDWGTGGQLIGAASNRFHTLDYFRPRGAKSSDSDGSVPRLQVTTRDFPTGQLNANTITKIRLRYLLSGSRFKRNVGPSWGGFSWGQVSWGYSQGAVSDPHIKALYSDSAMQGATWGQFDWGSTAWSFPTGAFQPLGDDAPAAPQGGTYAWPVGQKSRFARFLLRADDQPASMIRLASLEVLVRDSARI